MRLSTSPWASASVLSYLTLVAAEMRLYSNGTFGACDPKPRTNGTAIFSPSLFDASISPERNNTLTYDFRGNMTVGGNSTYYFAFYMDNSEVYRIPEVDTCQIDAYDFCPSPPGRIVTDGELDVAKDADIPDEIYTTPGVDALLRFYVNVTNDDGVFQGCIQTVLVNGHNVTSSGDNTSSSGGNETDSSGDDTPDSSAARSLRLDWRLLGAFVLVFRLL